MRGQVAHPLNWILVLFAGAVFLIFFLVLIRGLTDENESKQSVAELTYIRDLIESSQSNPDTTTNFLTKRFETDCLGIYSARMMPQTLSFPGQAIFSPPVIEGETILWSHQFDLGGPLMALSYMVSEETAFVLLDRSPLPPVLWAREILPKNATIIESTTDDIKSGMKQYSDLIILSRFNINGQQVTKHGNQRITGIFIEPKEPNPLTTAKIYSDGKLTFYSLDTNDRLRPSGLEAYLGKELLVAGILSGSADRYACGRAIAEKKVRLVSRINRERLKRLNKSITQQAHDASTLPDPRCISAYNDAIWNYDILVRPDKTINNSAEHRTYLIAKQRLSYDNTQLGMATCPMIY